MVRKESVADTPVLEETQRMEQPVETNNRGNFTRNLNKEADESVARKMFLGGLALLPWLHLVNVIFYRKQFIDPTIDAKVTLCTSYKSAFYSGSNGLNGLVAMAGVRRSFMGFCFWTIVFISWVLLFQMKWKDFGWQSLVMVVPEEDVNLGW
ncbi:hypothetical protein CCR75_006839 [Bremia lactucae]|uniref:Uncharacterized protein n=1 Tax=Bremia lactucae TaxID=4779 RepID=A0A976ILG9_BRELC|nr:hypothetical protein CCR75_006839 [Bremia lactucae]